MSNVLDMSIDLDKIMQQLEQMGASKLFLAAEESLKAVHSIITPGARGAIGGHIRTGKTARSLTESPNIKWTAPTEASLDVGFRLRTGYKSIFLMYGTPRVYPDPSFYNAFYGHDGEIEAAQIKALEALLE